MNKTLLTTVAGALLALPAMASNYAGNGATGFGGPVGTGSLDVTDTPTSLTFTFNRGGGAMNDDLVVYLDTQAGGFVDSAAFFDNQDGGRTAVSGSNTGNPSQTVVTFLAGFTADYALSIQNGFIGVFGLAPGGNGSLNFLFGQAQSGNNLDASYSITLSAAQMALIGLTAGSGQSFSLEGTLISPSAYRSNETIGNSLTVPGDGSGNAAFNNPQVFTSANVFTLQTVPEPTTMTMAALGGLSMLLAFRRR